MTQPVRIQRKRTKGFNLYAESLERNGLPCVYVRRPTRFGNPFSFLIEAHGIQQTLICYRNAVLIALRQFRNAWGGE